MALKVLSEHRCFEGVQGYYSHASSEIGLDMRFSVYRPPQAEAGRVPVLYYLAGLTCTEETFAIKAGAQRAAAELGLMLVCPDTSPRGANVPGEADSWDFGLGAGFYVDATAEPWAKHYRMYSYVTRELPALIAAEFPADPQRQGIFGHSMGGHGALVCALRNPDVFRSVSAFAPIVAPSQVPWGLKAFGNYLGANRDDWINYDATHLVQRTGAARSTAASSSTRGCPTNSSRSSSIPKPSRRSRQAASGQSLHAAPARAATTTATTSSRRSCRTTSRSTQRHCASPERIDERLRPFSPWPEASHGLWPRPCLRAP